MADSSASEFDLESETSSVDEMTKATSSNMELEHLDLQKKVDYLEQQNRILKMELDTYIVRTKTLQVSHNPRAGSTRSFCTFYWQQWNSHDVEKIRG